MVREQIESRGVRDPRVLDAMRRVPREQFVGVEHLHEAFDDRPLPIGEGQTISQPFIVARMTELLNLPPQARVLEIGAGCGYQTAVLAELAGHVYAIERNAVLVELARRNLSRLGYTNISLRHRDGYFGWKDPGITFQGILVACATAELPPPLLAQLAPGGTMVIPLGTADTVQALTIIRRDTQGHLHSSDDGGVRFVPMKSGVL